MSEGRNESLPVRAMARALDFSVMHPVMVLAGSLVLMAAAALYCKDHLGINTDTSKMISKELPFQREEERDRELFPLHSDTLTVVVDSQTPEATTRAVARLAERMRAEPGIFESVFAPTHEDFFQRAGLLYKSTAELQDYADQLAEAQPFLAKLTRDPSLRGLFSRLNEALDAAADGRKLELGRVFAGIEQTVLAHAEGKRRPLSWSALMAGDPNAPQNLRQFIIAKPRLNFLQLLPSERAIDFIHAEGREAGAEIGGGVRARVTGDLALNYEEMKNLQNDLRFAGIVSLVLGTATLWFAFRSVRFLLMIQFTVVLGLMLTTGAAALMIGHLNMISVAFAVLYIGLGGDHAIHLCLHYKDALRGGGDPVAALRECARDIAPSLMLCALMTIVGFFAFIPTAYKGVSELGLISGVGMFISLVITITVLPALLALFPARAEVLGAARAESNRPHVSVRWGVVIRRVAAVAAVFALALLPLVAFDYDPLNLRDPRAESVQTIHDMMKSAEHSMWQVTVLADDERSARDLAEKLRAEKQISSVVGIHSFVPEDQEEKLAILDELNLMLGPDIIAGAAGSPPALEEQLAAVEGFEARLESYKSLLDDAREKAGAERLQAALTGWLGRVRHESESERARWIGELDADLLGSFGVTLAQLRTALAAEPVTMDDIPAQIRERYLSSTGVFRLEVSPAKDPGTPEEMEAFVDAARSVAPHPTGGAVARLESGKAVIGAFHQAFAGALIVIFALLIIVLRSLRDSLLVLAPLLLAGLFTGAASVVFGIEFNFANVIALPLLLGLGVDNGIHVVHRLRDPACFESPLMTSSTARGILYNTLVNIFGFGALALVHHRGLASMAQILAIGMLFSLVCSLMILPAILHAIAVRSNPPSSSGGTS